MCFIQFSEQSLFMSLYRTNWFFIVKTVCVFALQYELNL
jgi:hypothetical protein